MDDRYLATLGRRDQLRVGTGHDARDMCLLVSLYANNLSLMPVLSSRSGGLDRAFFVRAARHVTSIMKRTPSTLTLRIDALGRGELLHLRRLLERLAPFGGRISVVSHERVLNLVCVDSSVFHLVLDGRPAAS
jgi:hypothetical protein